MGAIVKELWEVWHERQVSDTVMAAVLVFEDMLKMIFGNASQSERSVEEKQSFHK